MPIGRVLTKYIASMANTSIVGLFMLAIILVAAGCAGRDHVRPDENIAPVEAPKITASDVQVSDFYVGPGDTIEITVYRHDDLKRTVKIDPSGRIMFPLIGEVQALNKSVFALREELESKLSKYLVSPQVSISISSVQSQKVMVIGEVSNPGVFSLDSRLTVMESISKAGSLTDDAKADNVVLIRRGADKSVATTLNLKKAFKDGDLADNVYLQGGDIVYVPAVTIANVSWFFGHLSKILAPVVNLESGIILFPQAADVIRGEQTDVPISIPAN